jgi:hypothetical protein
VICELPIHGNTEFTVEQLNRFCEIIADMSTTPFTQAPPGYLELCARLQVERNPANFNLLVQTINHLLREYERSNGDRLACESIAPSVETIIGAASL